MRSMVGIDEVGRAAKKKRASPDSYVMGIDEVGRGALAGPIVVAAVALGDTFKVRGNRKLGKLRDSKKLSAKQRERWFDYLTHHPALCYSIARVYPRVIERINISGAANRAAFRAYKRLSLKTENSKIYLDGGLYLGRKGNPSLRSERMIVRTIIRGDEKIRAVAMASIIAKVTRDRAMTRLAKKYPTYGFEIHKGYGTKAHFAAVRRYGPSEAHRLTYLGFLENLKPKVEKYF